MPLTAEAPVAKAAALAPFGGSAPVTADCRGLRGNNRRRHAEAHATMTAAQRPVFLAAAN